MVCMMLLVMRMVGRTAADDEYDDDDADAHAADIDADEDSDGEVMMKYFPTNQGYVKCLLFCSLGTAIFQIYFTNLQSHFSIKLCTSNFWLKLYKFTLFRLVRKKHARHL